jgi:hypothetical protein
VSTAAAFAAWVGAAVIVLADGRRGLAVGIALVAAAFAVLAWADGFALGGAFLLAGGAVAVVALLRSGRQDWGLVPEGSTPRLILAVVGGILSLWVAASITSGPHASLRFATLAVVGLMAGRLLQAKSPSVLLTAASGLALAVGGASDLGSEGAGLAPYLVAAVIAAGASFLPITEPRGA